MGTYNTEHMLQNIGISVLFYLIGMPDVIQNIRISVVVQHIGSDGDAYKIGCHPPCLSLSDETVNTEAPCHSRCDTLKIPPCTKAIGADPRTTFCSLHRQW